MDIEKTMKDVGLFAVPLNSGDEWMVGYSNRIYQLNIGSDHYQDESLAIAWTLKEAIRKWTLKH